jgi:glycosyltransferase involved in cell wall biosynthesis
MRIMHVLKHSVRGNGNVHVAVDLACTQADQGDEVVFVSSRGSYDDLLLAHGVRVVTIREAANIVGAARGAVDLIGAARTFRPQIIHAHMMSSAVLGYVAGKVTGARLVTTMHNSFDEHSFLMKLGKVVVAVSEAERGLLISRGYRPTQVITVLNGANATPRFQLVGEDLGPLKRPCVLTLCGLHPRKAVDDVISAFARVSDDFPEWHLNIVGWGAEQGRLEAQVHGLGLDDSVHFLGATLNPAPLLEATDIFASGSLADPCPLTIGEARGAGAAIVATAVGGVPEVLEHGRAGTLTPPRDPVAMAEAFRALMADPDLLARRRADSLAGADHFTVARMTADYRRVYSAVLR